MTPAQRTQIDSPILLRMRWCSLAVIAPAVAGCSLIYNPNNLPDPRTIDAALQDSNPCALVLDSITPSLIEEGQGDFGSAPALLVVHGNNIVNTDLQVELRPPAGKTVHLSPIADLAASHDTTYLAFTVASMVDDKLEADVPLDVVVTQGGSAAGGCTRQATLTGQLTLRGRKELTALANLDPQYTYSQVMLPSVTPTGSTGLEIHAVSSITVGTITASATTSATIAAAGPGGFDGGSGGGNGPGGGGVGGTVSGLGLGNGGGGGGGGHAADGKRGGAGAGGLNAGTAGVAGLQCGDDELLGMNDRASSGGGGGAGGLTALGTGGLGGGGGGAVKLFAGGDLHVDAVLARGGDGGAPKGGGGGGGGGAGGTVLLRTANGKLTVPMVHVAGGVGAGPNGGSGSVGRVRWDAPGETPPGSPDTTPVRGPSFVVSKRIFTTASPPIDMKGPSSRAFTVRVIDQDGVPHDSGQSFTDTGTVAFAPRLSPGRNQLCMILDSGPQTTVADQCIAVAYLP
jgi:hypothetical protein